MNDPVTLIMLVLAVVIFIKLRSVLGRKTGNERTDLDYDISSRKTAAQAADPTSDNVVPLPTAQGNNQKGMTMAGEDEMGGGAARSG